MGRLVSGMTAPQGTSDGAADGAASDHSSANACIVSLVRAGEAFVGLTNRALRPYRLSTAGRQALAVLEGAGEPLTPTEIARRLIVTTATITSVLDTLEGRGLVERRPDPDDRRRLRIAITPAGAALAAAFVPEVVALQTAVMAGIAEPDRRRLITLVQQIHDAIAAVDVDAALATH
jgi:DNA-binding MarR family transcriptional regulator